MTEGLTFPMRRESESASRLRQIISDMLPLFSEHYSHSDDDILSEYITVIVCNGKSQRQARDYLEAFLGEQSGEFVACLWEHLLKDITQGKRETSGSETRTGVEFGSHDTLIEQGSSSRSHDEYVRKATTPTYRRNVPTTAREDVEVHVSPKARSMKMLRQELINSPCKRTEPKRREDWNLSDVNYSRKVLRSVIVSAAKQPCRMNPDGYRESMDERSGIQKRVYFPEREMRQSYFPSVPSGGAVSARSHDATSSQEMNLHGSVWDRLGRPGDKEYPILPKFRIQANEHRAFEQHGRAFPAAYIEQHSERFQREAPAVTYRHRVFPPLEARKPKSGTITYTEPHIAHNLSRKRRYGIINPNCVDASVGDLSSAHQRKQAKQDVEKPSLLSYQSKRPNLFSEIVNMKQKLQQLERQINQAKQFKKQKVGEFRGSPQSVELQKQHGVTESSIIHVTNVHYAASKEAISMLFSKCGAVKNITFVTDPVTRHPMGAAFVTFASKESVNKAIALSGTMFYSRPIKVSESHMITSGGAPQVVTES
ncbi:unnamed protein product [Eruca vesicaria subsp. sativa]|uniref:RRM domain-containing protein n=1 Tax=Eruca vesicaria subsp. sativa TaxID=29727 RepID=A0ABC8L1H1_ERUVS|nr:unnamed protein product [Eruca vesicaria subsp. sativa]